MQTPTTPFRASRLVRTTRAAVIQRRTERRSTLPLSCIPREARDGEHMVLAYEAEGTVARGAVLLDYAVESQKIAGLRGDWTVTVAGDQWLKGSSGAERTYRYLVVRPATAAEAASARATYAAERALTMSRADRS